MRQNIDWGLAPNDKKGMDARTFSMAVEDTFEEIYMFLSGNASTVSLPPGGLSITKGGTGANTVELARYNMGIYTDTNGQLALGGNVSKLYDDRIQSMLAGTNRTMSKDASGRYVIVGCSAYALQGFKYLLPKDELGNVLCGCEIAFDTAANKTTVSVYAIKYTNGKAVLDKSALISIPSGRCIDLNVR